MGRWVDISMAVTDGLRTNSSRPGEEVQITYDVRPEADPTGMTRTVRRVNTRLHIGTHIDGPEHFTPTGKRVDQYPLDAFVGRAWVVDMTHKVPKGMITTAELDALVGKKVAPGDILIVRTGWNSHYQDPDFFTDSPYFEAAAADWCVAKGIKMVVIDCLADAHGAGHAAAGPGFKDRLLRNNILNMTNADGLDQIRREQVTLYAFPLKIVPSEAGLTRAVVWEE